MQEVTHMTSIQTVIGCPCNHPVTQLNYIQDMPGLNCSQDID